MIGKFVIGTPLIVTQILRGPLNVRMASDVETEPFILFHTVCKP